MDESGFRARRHGHSQNEAQRHHRAVLHKANPCCHWCGIETVLPEVWKKKNKGGRLPPNLATIDHMRQRGDPSRRGDEYGRRINVLACYSCNNKRGAEFIKSQSSEWHWRRCNSWPRMSGFMMYDLMTL